MVVPLDSPRWQSLHHAYGSAQDTPDLIRAIRREKEPIYGSGGAWFDVYSSLFHQGSTYSATYAALPHLIAIAATGTLGQRIAILRLVAEIQIHGQPTGLIPDDLSREFAALLPHIQKSALEFVRAAAASLATETVGFDCSRADLLVIFGGLHQPRSGYVVQFDHMLREEGNVEVECPSCQVVILAELRKSGINLLRLDGRGGTEPNSGWNIEPDRTHYPDSLARGRAILDLGAKGFASEDTPFVLAALAEEFGESLCAGWILDLGTVVPCVYCEQWIELATGLQPL